MWTRDSDHYKYVVHFKWYTAEPACWLSGTLLPLNWSTPWPVREWSNKLELKSKNKEVYIFNTEFWKNICNTELNLIIKFSS